MEYIDGRINCDSAMDFISDISDHLTLQCRKHRAELLPPWRDKGSSTVVQLLLFAAQASPTLQTDIITPCKVLASRQFGPGS